MTEPLEALAQLVAERVARRPIPKRALTKTEAAESLSISTDHLDRFVLPEIRVLRIGRRVLIPTEQLDEWIDKEARFTLEGPE